MSLFQCEVCGCCENTALSMQGFRDVADWFDYSGMEDRKGKLLCSECGPSLDSDGDPSGFGKWHGAFDKILLPLGEFKTNDDGNLEHIKTGDTNFRKFALKV